MRAFRFKEQHEILGLVTFRAQAIITQADTWLISEATQQQQTGLE